MKESHGEGVANHTGPESCVAIRKGGGEALIGVRAGWVLSRERGGTSERPRPRGWRKAISDVSLSETRPSLARSETPCMHGNTSGGNRENPLLSRGKIALDRIEKSKDKRR